MEKGTSFLIEDGEKEGLSTRLKDAIGSESINSFAKRSSLSEGTVRNIIMNGVMPRLDNLIAMANTAGVTVEWLATGRGPKTYAKQMATDARLDETPESPLPLDSQEYKTKKEAIGVATRTSKKTCDDAIEIAEYTPSEGVKEYLKTFIFFSIVGEEIDTALAARFLIALKESTAKDKSKIEIKGGGDFSF